MSVKHHIFSWQFQKLFPQEILEVDTLQFKDRQILSIKDGM